MREEPPEGLLDAFWAYERALAADDLAALDGFFAPGGETLRGDPGGLLVGHDQIQAFRAVRGGAPARDIAELRVQVLGADAAAVVAVTAPRTGGHGLQTQVWKRLGTSWQISAAHVSPPPSTFDPRVWRVVGNPLVPSSGAGALVGETVAVKDVFAVAGYAVGAGVPAYLAEQEPATEHSPALARLLAAGAAIRGIAQTDQFAYSLAGDNPHYGTPVNALVPAALPGGSSNGPATAVALGAATIGLATDTAGSVRVPASYQGLWGLRTTHGSVPVDGMVPLSRDFDAVGLLTRTPELLLATTRALLPSVDPVPLGEMIGLDDLGPLDLPALAEAFRTRQGFQIWTEHGAWITAHPGAVTGAPAERFAAASRVTASQNRRALAALASFRSVLETRLDDAVLSLPSASSAAPRLWATPAEHEAVRTATFALTCIAGVTGRPVVAYRRRSHRRARSDGRTSARAEVTRFSWRGPVSATTRSRAAAPPGPRAPR
ncbi:MAG: AtzH-like domain-containing protein [Marmoricola sp.]